MLSLLRPLRARDPEEGHRAATQLELFFDLVSVIAIATITSRLHHAISEGHGVDALGMYVFVFFAVWWAWMNFTWFASAFDNDGPAYRLLVMVIMLGELIFAGGAGRIFDADNLHWGVAGWCVMRVGMAGLWLRASADKEYRVTALRYAGGIVIAQICWIAILFFKPGSTAFLLWGAFVYVIELCVPVFAERARTTPFHRHHVIERYGLLTIITLGEIMLSISLGFGLLYDAHPNWGAAGAAASAFVIVFGVFWVYFCEEEHLPKRDMLSAFVWGYGHIFLFIAIATLGAGIAAEIDLAAHHSHVTRSVVAWWVGVPLALFYLSLWFVRDRMMDLSAGRAVSMPAMAVASLAAAALGLPTLAFALVATIAVVWRAPLAEPDC
ncbi:MAG: low temperature requirement protein A [Parvularculaceae bacterium]|nr:low temperature requirement protein A [Parvularculaceae bacterium]